MLRAVRNVARIGVAASLLATSRMSVLAAEGKPGAREDEAQAIARAIDAIRGQDLTKLSAAEKDEFGRRLDASWNFLIEHKRKALPAVEAALTGEREDSFRIIDLAHLLIVLDNDRIEQSAGFLLKADPNAYSDRYFEVTAGMASQHCKGCLPAVLRMLEVEALDASIPEHALPVGNDLGITFTIGQYGDAALPGVREALTSGTCAVRANAALAISLLLPAAEPPALAAMALEDPCETARNLAWDALGALDASALPRLAMQRLDAPEGPSVAERRFMVVGLSRAFSRSVIPVLERLQQDPDPDVAQAAREARDDIENHAPTPAHLKANAGSASPTFRSRALRLLKKARDKGVWEFEGKRSELLPAFTANDLPLLNEARAAVLVRVSDECLYEYYDLTYVARAVRVMGAGSEP